MQKNIVMDYNICIIGWWRNLGPDAEVLVGDKLRPVLRIGIGEEEGVHMAEDDDGDGAQEEHVLPQLVTIWNTTTQCHHY